MDKKSALAAPAADKESKQDPLAEAKKAFDEAVQKTNDGLKAEGEDEKVIVEPVKRKAEKPEPKPAPKKVEPSAEKVELERIKRELAELRAQKAEPKKEEPKVSDFDAIKAELAEQFGEDEGEILTRVLRAAIEPRERRIAQMEEMIQKAVEQSKVQSAKTNRARISKEYAHLGDSDEAWGIVQSQAQAAFSQGKHETIEEAFDATAQALYGAVKEQAEEAAEEEASRIAASTPTQPSAARRERKMTAEQVARAQFDHLLKHPEDVAGAKRLAAQFKTKDL